MIYELTNPSDPYTLRVDNPRHAIAAALLLGHGSYGLKDGEGETVLPIFLLGGFEEWAREQSFDLKAVLDNERSAVADALDSVVIGSLSERLEVEEAAQRMTAAARQEWLSARHERRRSSMNNIGDSARWYADRLRIT